MNRSEKQSVVSSLKDSLSSAGLVVITRQSGLTVTEVSALRAKIREAGAGYKVLKNTLSRLAVADTPYEGVTQFLSGPTAIAFSADPIAAAKAVADFAKDNQKLEIVGGSMGDKVLTKAEVDALAKLPSLDELRGKIIGVISAPATKIAGVTQAPAAQLARVFSAYGNSGR